MPQLPSFLRNVDRILHNSGFWILAGNECGAAELRGHVARVFSDSGGVEVTPLTVETAVCTAVLARRSMQDRLRR